MPKPNLKERLSLLASLDDESLARLRDMGLCVTIDPNGTITMSPAPLQPPTEKKRRDAEAINQAYS